MKVLKTTICGTDLGIYKGKNPEIESGRILGHEGVGIIEEIGGSVSQFKKGDKVLISCITSCGSCEYCKKQSGFTVKHLYVLMYAYLNVMICIEVRHTFAMLFASNLSSK